MISLIHAEYEKIIQENTEIKVVHFLCYYV